MAITNLSCVPRKCLISSSALLHHTTMWIPHFQTARPIAPLLSLRYLQSLLNYSATVGSPSCPELTSLRPALSPFQPFLFCFLQPSPLFACVIFSQELPTSGTHPPTCPLPYPGFFFCPQATSQPLPPPFCRFCFCTFFTQTRSVFFHCASLPSIVLL